MNNYLVITLLLGLASSPVHGQTTMFSARPLAKGEACLFTMVNYNKTVKRYDWTSRSWAMLSENEISLNLRVLPMAGYGITGRLSLFIQYPVYDQVRDNIHTVKQGDLLLMSRYALIPASSRNTGLTLIGALNLPTAPAADNPYADGSTGIILGEIFSTRWYGRWRTHIKSEFCFYTRDSGGIYPGREIKLLWKQDLSLGKIKLFTVNQYAARGKRRDENREVMLNTQNYRLLHLIGVDKEIAEGLNLKLKAQVPSKAAGGSMYKQRYILDLAYYF